MNQSFAIHGYSRSDMMVCVVDGCDIYQTDSAGGSRLIGKTQSAYEELEGTTKQYYDKLVELGVITPEKTPQEMMSEMQDAMMKMTGIITSLTDEIKELKGRGSKQNIEHGGADVSQRKPVRGGGKGAGSDQRDVG